MALPRVVIIGRPNVGKSSLLNRLAGRRVSIVDPTPGVTRDRIAALVEIDPPEDTPRYTPSRLIELTDTGGYGVYVAAGKRYDDVGADLATLTEDIEHQIATAVEQAGLILFVIDAQAGVTSLDHTIATLLRKRSATEKVLLVANKVDDEKWEAHGLEAAELGFGEPVCVSATSGHRRRGLTETIYTHLPEDTPAATDDQAQLRLAIVGKRNAGKSTLINTLAGEDRVIVSEIAGTTRDSVDCEIEIQGRRLLAIDTAGVRKRKSFADDIEYYSYHRMLRSIRRADVAMLLIDATQEVSQVDKKLSQELQRQFKPTVIVINKWDLVEDTLQPENYVEYLTQELRGFDYAPLVFISAATGDGLTDAIGMALNLHEQASHRETTGQLNSIIEAILEKRGPSSKLGTRAKVYYVSQISTNPPTIVMVVNNPKLFRGRYERYLMNRLREELPFSEVPIRLFFRQRKRGALRDTNTKRNEIT